MAVSANNEKGRNESSLNNSYGEEVLSLRSALLSVAGALAVLLFGLLVNGVI